MSVLIAPSCRDDVLKAVRALLEPTRVTPGCLGCLLYHDAEEPDAIMLVEEWTSQSELNRYLASDACKTLIAAMELSLQPPLIRFDEIASRAGIEVIEAARRAYGLLQDFPSDAREDRS
ncbi:putative quinol monooxygenase [Thiocystis violacea]|uniref:putative quinol monooxygenase n=1 Tax=Thiocystis violacea TaxID=13725 RepID=UPI00190879EE|nr:antibiotic biosynthesis monooxygenase [Thiocystis violacea]